MLKLIAVLLGFGVPWAAGFFVSAILFRYRGPGDAALNTAFGFLLSIALISLALWFGGQLISLSTMKWAVLILSFGLLFAAAVRWRRSRDSRQPSVESNRACRGDWPRWVGILAGVLIAQRLGALALEVGLQPMFPWDSWMNWAPKALIWFENDSILPFTGWKEWLEARDARVYTIESWNYPPLVPLVQLWSALLLGEWDDALVNIGWFLTYLAYCSMIYGFSRYLRFSPVGALIWVYIGASLPMLNVHVALGGYADIWVGIFYAGSSVLYWIWLRERQKGILFLLAVMLFAMTQTKLPGWLWAATILAPLSVFSLTYSPVKRLRLGLLTAVLAVTVLGVASVLCYTETFPARVRGICASIKDGTLDFYNVADAVIPNLLVLNNWNLFWYSVPLLLVAGMVMQRTEVKAYVAAVLPSFMALTAVTIIFFFTSYYVDAQNYTTLNRALLHIVPGTLIALMTIVSGSPLRLDPFNRKRPAVQEQAE